MAPVLFYAGAMLNVRMHPATVIILWSLVVVYLLAKAGSISFAVAAAGVALLALPGWTKFWLMVRRMRFLLLAITVSFPLITPGQIVSILPWITFEGLALALQQLMTLLLMAGMVALLMTLLTMHQLLLGLMILISPLNWLGVDTGRVAVRLGLTLDAMSTIDSLPAGSEVLPAASAEQEYFRLPAAPWRIVDFVALGGALILVALTCSGGWNLS